MTGRGMVRNRVTAALALLMTVILFSVAACEGLTTDEDSDTGSGGIVEAGLPQPCERAAGLLARADTLTLDGRRLKALATACIDRGARPQLGWALLGIAEQYLGDLSASEDALDEALDRDSDPGSGTWVAPLLAIDARARLLVAEGEPLAALEEVDAAGGLVARQAGSEHPQIFSGLFSERAALLNLAGRPEEAKLSYQRALLLAGSRKQRFNVVRQAGWTALASGRWAAAYRHLNQAYDLAPAAPQQLQLALQIYVAEAQGLDPRRARDSLTRRIEAQGLDLDLYPGLFLRYLLGELTAAEVRRRAGGESRLNPAATTMQVDYYLGLGALLEGNRRNARAAFERVVDSEVLALPEYFFAQDALARL